MQWEWILYHSKSIFKFNRPVPYGPCINPFQPFFEKTLQAAMKYNRRFQVNVITTWAYNMSHLNMSHIIWPEFQWPGLFWRAGSLLIKEEQIIHFHIHQEPNLMPCSPGTSRGFSFEAILLQSEIHPCQDSQALNWERRRGKYDRHTRSISKILF